jgi:hypothetical protein
LRFGIGGVSLSADNTIALNELSLAVQGGGAATPLARIESVEASFEELQMPPASLRPLEIRIKKPTLTIDHDAQFGSGLNDLIQLTRAPRAGHIVGMAKNMADSIAEEEGLELEEEDAGGGVLALLSQIDWSDFLAETAPQSLSITDATVLVTDARTLPLVTSDPKIALRNGNFEFTHRVINGELSFKGGFKALANEGESRGSAQISLTWNYRDNGLQLNAKIDALSVPWLVQLTSARFAENLRGGVLRADVKASRETGKDRLDFSGIVSAEDASFFMAMLAEKPVENLSASYTFEGFYNPNAPIPEPKLLRVAAVDVDKPQVDEGEQTDDAPAQDAPPAAELKPQPPTRGAFVITKGHFEFNDIPGEFRPALYGIDGLSRRPARFDVAVTLPTAPVNALFEAVPDAIKGPLVGTEMTGEFGWTLDLEIPLYEAGDMEWESKPVLTNFELVSMPEEVDVRKMREEFEMTIYDPKIKWSRKVTIPAMRPVPIDWLVRHSGLEAEEFEERRREREWPPRYAPGFVADPDGDGVPNLLEPRPAPWAADDAADAAPTLADTTDLDPFMNPTPGPAGSNWGSRAPAPKQEPKPRKVRDGEIPPELLVMLDGEKKEHPYGPYVYVPLHHISPWMLRAAITTEDNSFFTHHGFNWFAVQESVEDNIEAGRYVRGASTISMQLVKNVFLTRKKVMVRKLREIFLVWLMEDVVDIPKSRILELYFNVIEYGPGIFGVHDAAVHYFGKRADQLDLTEVAWLVSIVPNPKKYHFYYERGEISDHWFRRTLRYVRYMMNRGRVTEAEYEMAKLDKPQFYKPADGEPMMRIERDPTELQDIFEDAQSLEIPGLGDLFGP